MGATDPAKAAPGTIRKVHARSIGENLVHGSDAPETAHKEIAQFFSGNEIGVEQASFAWRTRLFCCWSGRGLRL